MSTITAYTLNPEYFDPDYYSEDYSSEPLFTKYSDFFRLVKKIYENYYDGDEADFVQCYIPEISAKDAAHIIKLLEEDVSASELIIACLNAAYHKKFTSSIIRGSSQVEHVECFHPIDYPEKQLRDYEAWLFATGTEVKVVYDDDKEDYFMFYTSSFSAEDIKKEVAEHTGADISDIKLYLYKTTKIHKEDIYEEAD